MKMHVLPGDSIVESFKEANIEGEIGVCREALIDGDVSGETLPEFWKSRAAFIGSVHSESEDRYLKNVAGELEKLLQVLAGDKVFLWFEYELFCQVNYWFCLSLLNGTAAEIFRVSPIVRNDEDKWKGFGRLSAEDMRSCFAAAVRLDTTDIQQGGGLWKAYRSSDSDVLRRLSEPVSGAFPMLSETVEAAIAKDELPQAVVREIIDEGVEGFDQIFDEFSKRAGVYGFGDSQVRRILESL